VDINSPWTADNVYSLRIFTWDSLSNEARARAYEDWDASNHAPIAVFILECKVNDYRFGVDGSRMSIETNRTNTVVNFT
jgi:hypothetical protein